MPKFVFPLQAVLKQRKHVEQEKQRELATVQQQMTTLELELKALNDEIVKTTGDLRDNHLVGRLDLSYLASHRRYVLATQRKGMAIMQRMALISKQLEEARRALAEAARHRKAIEKLREKQFDRWRATQEQRELAEQDDMSMKLSYFEMQSDS